MLEVQSGYADINGARLYYEMAGVGHPIVLVHAGIADSGMWDDQFEVLAATNRVLRYDQRGFGKSEPVAGEYSTAGDLYALLKFHGLEQVVLIGCSMGGGACMDLTLDHPELVRALVMVASAPSGLWLDVPLSDLEPRIEAALQAKDLDLACELETQLWFDGEGRGPQDVDAMARARLWAMNRRAIELASRALGRRVPPPQPAAERLDSLQVPVLILYGDRDEAYSRAAAVYMETHIAGAKRILFQNTAHLLNMESPVAFNAKVLAFLQEQGLS
jgi:pimeloyl-ACP methyl ester carboxylesterase